MSLPTHFPLKVADGKTIQIPSVGYGTWSAGSFNSLIYNRIVVINRQTGEKNWCRDAVLAALKAGYHHLDCAWMYGVDQEIGEAIKESGIPRSEIFVTSKFWPHFAAPENVELCLDIVLKQMGLEYVDLWLAHWPYAVVPISREALLNAKTGPGTSSAQRGIQEEDGKPVIDWEHTSANIAKIKGLCLPPLAQQEIDIMKQAKQALLSQHGKQWKLSSETGRPAPLVCLISPSKSSKMCSTP